MSATLDDLFARIDADLAAGGYVALAPCDHRPVSILVDFPHRFLEPEAEGRVGRITEAYRFVTANIHDISLSAFFNKVRLLKHGVLHTMNGIHKADSPQAVSYAFYLWISDTVEAPLVFDLPVVAWVKPGLETGPELWMRKENWDEWVRVYRFYHVCNDAPDNIDPAGFRP